MIIKLFESFNVDNFYKINNIDPDKLSYMGKGDFGTAYAIGDGRVLKITSSFSEYEIAKELIGKNYPGFVKFFAAEENSNKFYIIMEELEEDSSIEDLYYDLSNMLETQNVAMQYMNYFDEEQYLEEGNIISDELRKFMSDIEDINRSYRRLGIEASDLRPENMGRDKEGNVKAFDIEDRTRSKYRKTESLYENYRQDNRYFHGTYKNNAGEKILADGYIKPGNTTLKRGNKLTPIIGRTYVTPDIKTACIYSIGGIYMSTGRLHPSKGEEYGYVFEVDLGDRKVIADEDFIGMAVNLCYHSLRNDINTSYYKENPEVAILNWKPEIKNEYLQFAKSILTPLQFKKCLDYDDYGDFAVAGKKMAKMMSQRMHDWLLESGTPGSVEGNIDIKHAWRIDRGEDPNKIYRDASNFFEVAKKIK
jgi:serine/threonine protein kinase